MIRCGSRAENPGRSSYSSGVRTKEICLQDQFLSIFRAVHVRVRAGAQQPLLVPLPLQPEQLRAQPSTDLRRAPVLPNASFFPKQTEQGDPLGQA